MIRAKRGLLEFQSLEDSCLSADGEDFTTSLQPQPVFSRPGPASRSRSSTCTSSSGASDGSSSGSQSSIGARSRTRARGQGHCRRISQARMSHASVYETIEEEMSSYSSTPSPVSVKQSGPVSPISVIATGPEHAVYVVNPSISSIESVWDDDRGLVALRKYYALRDEAHETVTESKLIWPDTHFSVFATQAFDPSRHASAPCSFAAELWTATIGAASPSYLLSYSFACISIPSTLPYFTTSCHQYLFLQVAGAITCSACKAPRQQVSINPNQCLAKLCPSIL